MKWQRTTLWVRHLLRFIGILAIALLLVGLGYSSLAVPLSGDFRVAFFEGALTVLAVTSLWKIGDIRYVQAKSRLALLEVGILGLYYVVLFSILPFQCDPLRLCLGGPSGGYEQFAQVLGYLDLLAVWVLVAFGEEMFARGYVIGDILTGGRHWDSRQWNNAAVIISTGVFLALHAFVIYRSTNDVSSVEAYALEITAAGIFYGVVYISTERNLALTILMHFFFDAYAPLVSVNPTPTARSVLLLLVIVVPGLLVAYFHGYSIRSRQSNQLLPAKNDHSFMLHGAGIHKEES